MTDATYQDDAPDWAKVPLQAAQQDDSTPDWAKVPLQAAQQDDSTPDWARATASSSTALGSAAQGAVLGAAGGVAGGWGAVQGAEFGAGAGLATPIPGGAIIGGVAGAIAGGMGASWLASKGEDWILDKLGLRDGSGFLSRQQEEANQQQHGTAQFAGELLPNLIAFGSGAAGIGARAIGAGAMGGIEAGQEYASEGKVDPAKVGIAGIAGAIMDRPRGWTKAGSFERSSGVKLPDQKADPIPDATKKDVDNAQDVTPVAPGVAAENPPAPEVSGAGNPVGAPMVARESAPPTDPTRDYRKGAAPAAKGIETAPSQPGVSTAPIHEDIVAVLAPEPATPAPAQQAHVETGIEQAAAQQAPKQPMANFGGEQTPQVTHT